MSRRFGAGSWFPKLFRNIFNNCTAFPVALRRAGHTVANKKTWSFKSGREADIKTPKTRNIENLKLFKG